MINCGGTMEQIQKELEMIQENLLAEFKPLAIILFGSFARNSQNEDSDIDIAIVDKQANKQQLFQMKQKLQELTKKDIDLINLANVNISDGFRYEVLMNGTVIYCADTYQFDLFQLDAYREYLELNESRKDIIERMKKGGTIYGK